MLRKQAWRPTEPARELIYRRMMERLATQDDQITFLLDKYRALEKRVDWLTQLVQS